MFAGLVGGIVWNLLTWLLGIPSSSSHALIGGIVGAMLAAVGGHGVIWTGLVSKVLIPAVMAPFVAGLVAAVGTWLVYRFVRGVPEERTDTRLPLRPDRLGIAGLAGARHQRRAEDDGHHLPGPDRLRRRRQTDALPPFWVIFSCAVAIALGTYLGGWRVIRTLGKGLVEIKSPQGMAAETSSAAIILLSSHFGYSLSTTHVATGSILGSGVGKPGAEVRWGVAGRMAAAWLITLPAGGPRRRAHLLPRARHRRLGRHHRRLPAPGRRVGRDLAAVAQGADRPQQRQRRVGRQPHGGRRARGTRPPRPSPPPAV